MRIYKRIKFLVWIFVFVLMISGLNGYAQDKSLSIQEYINLGMPSYDRDWMGDDMMRAQKVLVSLASKNPKALPRLKDKESGKIFARIISEKNLGIYKNTSLPFQQRMTDCLNYFQALNNILKLYAGAYNVKAVTSLELVHLMGAVLKATVVMFDLTSEFMKTIDKTDPHYQQRMAGIKQMRNGLATIVAGILQSLTETKVYSPEQLKILVAYMEDTFPRLVPQLPQASRQETITRIKTFMNDPKMKYLDLERLYKKLV